MSIFKKNFLRAIKQINSSISVEVLSPVIERYRFESGLHYESFDPLGNVRPWSLLSLVDCANNFFYLSNSNYNAFLDFDRFPEHYLFSPGTDVNIGEEMYDISLDKSKLDLKISLCHVGNKSITIKFDFYLPQTDKSITTGRLKVVLVNPVSRKLYPVPHWWKEKYLHLVPDDNNNSFVIPSASESEHHDMDGDQDSLPVKVLASSLDANFHAGWYLQVKMFLDAYVSWHYKRFGLEGNGGAYKKVKYMNVHFIKEAFLEDIIKIRLNAVPERENRFQFFMSNEKGAVSESFVEFYPSV